MERFIPVLAVEDGHMSEWQLDTQNMPLSELIELRNSFIGVYEISVRALDRKINGHFKEPNTHKRECKKREKEIKMKLKRISKK